MPDFAASWAYSWTQPRFAPYAPNQLPLGMLGWARSATASAATEAYREVPESMPSVVGQSFGGLDFYNRVHFQFLRLDLGNLVSDQTTGLWVWNAWRRAIVLDTRVESNAEGITISGQAAPPLPFAPQEQKTFQLGISTNGPPTIDASYLWAFNTGEVRNLTVVGSRVTGFGWTANWREPVVERLEWATDVLTAYAGEEQRRSLRLRPRKALEFGVLVEGSERRLLEATLYGWGGRVWAVPLWWDGVELASGAAAGATTVSLDTTTRDFQAGGLAMFIGATAAQFEVAEVESVGPSSITMKRPLVNNWPAGTRAYPARACRFEPEQTLVAFTGDAAEGRLRFTAVEPDNWAAAASPTYRGYPVLEERPEWTSAPRLGMERKLSILDAVAGPRRVLDESGAPAISQSLRFTATGRAAIDTWRQRLHLLRGRHLGVWVPSWAEDFKVVATIGASDLAMDVESCGYTRYVAQGTLRRDVRIQTASGAVFYRRITGSSELSATVERLNLDTALGVTLAPGEVAMVSFLHHLRNAADAVEIAWWTGETADLSLTFRGSRNAV